MKNDIKYYYNLDPISIHQKDKKIYFSTENQNYLLEQIEKDMNYEYIYQLALNLSQYNVLVHNIVLNNNNKIITQLSDGDYILLKINISKRKIDFNDISIFSQYYSNIKSEFNWSKLWITKIDNLEYQINQLGKNFPELIESFSYYVGLAENAIQLFNVTPKKNIRTSLTHRRINNNHTTYDLYNPLNLIIDISFRGICDYINNSFFTSEEAYNLIDVYLKNNTLTQEEKNIFFSRILFPTYYFDMFENIIHKQLDEKEMKKIIRKINDYEKFITYVYNKLNIYNEMVEIEWIKKAILY